MDSPTYDCEAAYVLTTPPSDQEYTQTAPQPVLPQLPPASLSELLSLRQHLGLAPQPNASSQTADVVYISIDLEAFEHAHNKITEIGISWLDSRDIMHIPPGVDAQSWLPLIRSRHLRVSEYKHLVNKRFLTGCPDKFDFGTSEFVSLRNVKQVLTSAFENPTGRASADKREIVLVGHGLKNDTNYLKVVDFSPKDAASIARHFDTQVLSGSTKSLTIGLHRLLNGLELPAANLHNAGNDACLTLQAMVVLAIKHTNEPGAFFADVLRAQAPPKPYKRNRGRSRR